MVARREKSRRNQRKYDNQSRNGDERIDEFFSHFQINFVMNLSCLLEYLRFLFWCTFDFYDVQLLGHVVFKMPESFLGNSLKRTDFPWIANTDRPENHGTTSVLICFKIPPHTLKYVSINSQWAFHVTSTFMMPSTMKVKYAKMMTAFHAKWKEREAGKKSRQEKKNVCLKNLAYIKSGVGWIEWNLDDYDDDDDDDVEWWWMRKNLDKICAMLSIKLFFPCIDFNIVQF